MNILNIAWAPLLNSFLIGSVSALVTVLLGFLGAIGFIRLPPSFQKWLEFPLLLSGFVPPLYVSLGILNLNPGLSFGFHQIILAHAAMNVGWVTVKTAGRMRAEMSGFQELALVEGASPGRFWCGAGASYLFPFFWGQFRGLFAICFASFVVPLILGGSSWETVEVSIFRGLRLEGPSWGLAGLLCFQFLVVFGVSSGETMSRQRWQTQEGRRLALGFPMFFLVPAGLSLLGVVGLLWGLASAVAVPLSMIVNQIWSTVLAALLMSLFLWTFALAWIWVSPKDSTLRVWMSIGSLSPVAVGFLLLWSGSMAQALPLSDGLALLIATFTYGLLIAPVLVRMELHDDLVQLRTQSEIAECLGAGRGKIWREILLPQLRLGAARLVGIGVLWGTGEVALIGLLSKSDQTLALEAQALMGAYRLDQATLVVVIGLMIGALGFLLNRGIAYVGR